VNAEFFALAFVAALNPKLLALDLLLIESRRPRAMFLCLLLGGMTVALTVGLLDVLVFHADAIKAQGQVSAGVDLALGLLLLAAGALVGTPGASYLTALHNLVTGKSSTATQVVAVVIFVVIEFLLIIIPFAFLELRPEATKAFLKNAQDWLLSHALQLMAAIALLLGAYLAVSGLIRLSCPASRPPAAPAAGQDVPNRLGFRAHHPQTAGAPP